MRILLAAMLLGLSGFAVGCSDNNGGPKHETVQEKTTYDANGNVVNHSEDKQSNQNNP